MNPVTVLIAILALVIIFVGFIFVFYMKIWIRAIMSACPISFFELLGMKLRDVPPGIIVDAYIKAKKSSMDVTREQLECHYIAGGRVFRVVDAMIKAHARDIMVPFEVVAKTDLAGFDLETIDPEQFRAGLKKKQSSEPSA